MANDNTEPNMKRASESDTDYDCDYHDDDDDDNDADSDIDMEGVEDRLSDLPDCILIHIMTFLTTKDVVCTSILSRRWKDLWKHVPSLVLCTKDFKFRQMTRFNDGVSKFLLLRDGSVPLLSVVLHQFSSMRPDIQTSISEYAVMHNVERLKLHAERFKHLSPSVFSSQTLTSLHLSARRSGLIPKSLSMGALTSLHLKNFHFCAADNESLDPFSSCVKLKTLVLDNCDIRNSRILCISNRTLVSLTIHSRRHAFGEELVLSTPSLCSFAFSGIIAWQLSARINLSFLKEVTIDFDPIVELADTIKDESVVTACLQQASILIDWLQVFANTRSLTVCSGTLKGLSLIPELLNTGSPGLDNLQLLIVKLKDRSALLHKRHRATYFKNVEWKTTLVHAGVVDYLVRNSPLAEVNAFKREQDIIMVVLVRGEKWMMKIGSVTCQIVFSFTCWHF
ncbi:hypothetical protein PIB30_050900 [Stylosanthes scabra]|uniref:F-box domain-containing protein n=1 Tax=Stylosanthes scabra TaxID=79078 RepID=A0ABU6XFH8_9FABA|nr:hypothetical protein [Stylosanthes scabra]